MINISRYLCCCKKISDEKISDEKIKIKIKRMKKLPLYNHYNKIYSC